MSFYRTLFFTAGRATTAAASGTKYFVIPASNIDSSAPVGSGNAAGNPTLFRFQAADNAFSGLTTKLRVVGVVVVGTAPAVTITVGLYPVTAGANLTLGTVVSGSTVAFTTPAQNTVSSGDSTDFTVPSDGVYALGYIVSGTPSGAFTMHAVLQVRNV